MALPIKAEQDLVLLTASLSHPKTATNLLILIHQRADRMKKKSQKTTQTNHMDHSLV